MSKTKKSYADVISQTEMMINALRNNLETVVKRGLDEEFINQFSEARNTAISLNNRQEELKAELKTQTSMLNDKMDEVYSKLSEAKKVVKLAVPQAKWVEFGMPDKR